MTTIWPPECLWINQTVYVDELYCCIEQSITDTCSPCAQSSYGCGPQYTFEYNFTIETNRTYCPGKDFDCPFPARRHAAFRKLMEDSKKKAKPKGEAGTTWAEGYAGTFALPSNNVSIHIQIMLRICILCGRRGGNLMTQFACCCY
jgi:hypothetical protein